MQKSSSFKVKLRKPTTSAAVITTTTTITTNATLKSSIKSSLSSSWLTTTAATIATSTCGESVVVSTTASSIFKQPTTVQPQQQYKKDRCITNRIVDEYADWNYFNSLQQRVTLTPPSVTSGIVCGSSDIGDISTSQFTTTSTTTSSISNLQEKLELKRKVALIENSSVYKKFQNLKLTDIILSKDNKIENDEDNVGNTQVDEGIEDVEKHENESETQISKSVVRLNHQPQLQSDDKSFKKVTSTTITANGNNKTPAYQRSTTISDSASKSNTAKNNTKKKFNKIVRAFSGDESVVEILSDHDRFEPNYVKTINNEILKMSNSHQKIYGSKSYTKEVEIALGISNCSDLPSSSLLVSSASSSSVTDMTKQGSMRKKGAAIEALTPAQPSILPSSVTRSTGKAKLSAHNKASNGVSISSKQSSSLLKNVCYPAKMTHDTEIGVNQKQRAALRPINLDAELAAVVEMKAEEHKQESRKAAYIDAKDSQSPPISSTSTNESLVSHINNNRNKIIQNSNSKSCHSLKQSNTNDHIESNVIQMKNKKEKNLSLGDILNEDSIKTGVSSEDGNKMMRKNVISMPNLTNIDGCDKNDDCKSSPAAKNDLKSSTVSNNNVEKEKHKLKSLKILQSKSQSSSSSLSDKTNKDKPPQQKPPSSELTKTSTTNSSSTSMTRTIVVKERSYQVLNRIGHGGSSVVYQVYDAKSGKSLALKVVNLSSSDRSVVLGFRNEIKLLSSLRHCKRVVRMYDYEFRNNHKELLIVMEKGDEDLANVIKSFYQSEGPKLSPHMIRYYWHEMLVVVNEIHQLNVVHSDLKPVNFILVHGKLKLIDFGIANAIQAEKTSVYKDVIIGTVDYMAPEAFQRRAQQDGKVMVKYNQKADIWSLGIILYNLVYGYVPFHMYKDNFKKGMAILNEEIEYPPIGDELLLNVIKQCLQKDPNKRPTAAMLLEHKYLSDTKTTSGEGDHSKSSSMPSSTSSSVITNGNTNDAVTDGEGDGKPSLLSKINEMTPNTLRNFFKACEHVMETQKKNSRQKQ